MKKAAYGFGGIVVLLVAAALIVPSLIDWNSYKSEIAAEAEKATGRKLEIVGDLEIGLLPTPHLNVANVRFANAPGAAVPHMATLKELRASVKLLPLLTGNVEIASVELIEPVIELEKLADGTGNWAFNPPAGQYAAEKGDTGETAGGGGASDPQSFSLDLLRIERGVVVYRDAAKGSVERIENLTADLSAGSLTGPFTVDGGLQVKGVSLTVDVKIGKFAEQGAVPVEVVLGTPETKTRIGLKGTVTDIETTPTVSAKLDGGGDNLRSLVASLSGKPAPAALAHPYSLGATIKGGADLVTVSDLSVVLGKNRLTGDIKARLADTPQIDISLLSKSVDIDALLVAAAAPAVAANTPAAPAVTKPSASPNAPAETAAAGDGLPAHLRANIAVEIGEAIFRKGRVRDIRLEAALAGGALTLNGLTATVPGSGRLTASGRLTSPGGVMTFAGKSSFQTASLRAALQWFQVDVAAVPADRLRRFSLSSEMRATPAEIQIFNIDGQLDASRMSGGVTVALRDRPAFGASFSIDQFNVDAYLGKPSAADPGQTAEGTAGAATGEGASSSGDRAGAAPLAALKEFDANLAFRIGNLSYRNTAIRDVKLDGTLVNGTLTFREASVRNLAGTSARVTGTLSGFDGVPKFDGTVAAASNDLTGLFKVAGIDSPVPPRQLGRMRLTAKTNASSDRVAVDADLELAEARTSLKGTVGGLPASPVFDLSLDARHPEIARLAALFSDGRAGPGAGPMTLKIDLKGSEKALTVSATGGMTGGTLKVAGNIDTPATAPRLDIGIDLSQPDLVKFVRAFDAGFNPSKKQLGGLKLAARLQGTDRDMAIRDLAGNFGPTAFSGGGTYIDKAPRPALTLALKSSVIPLSDFLEASPASRQGAGGNRSAASAAGSTRAPASTSQRWSTEKIDTTALGLVDADIDLGAEALLYKTFRVDSPKIVAVLKDKVLNVSRVSGTMFDGAFDMKGTVDGRSVPTTTTSLTINKANVGKALFQAAEFDIADGVLTFGLDLAARGASQAEMIGNLGGKGNINVVNGVVKGFDLKKASDSLKNLNNVAGILGLLGSAMEGGSTRFSSLNGTFDIDKGVMTTKDLKLVADASEGAASGFVDLPKWHMDVTAGFRLTEHQGAPPFRVRAVGPPDDPRRIFDFQSLQAWVLQQGVGGLIQNLVPGLRNGSGTQSEQPSQQQQQAPKPEDILRGLFKGLGR